jgi:hypothetical protein
MVRLGAGLRVCDAVRRGAGRRRRDAGENTTQTESLHQGTAPATCRQTFPEFRHMMEFGSIDDHEGFSLHEGFSFNKRKILRDHGKATNFPVKSAAEAGLLVRA